MLYFFVGSFNLLCMGSLPQQEQILPMVPCEQWKLLTLLFHWLLIHFLCSLWNSQGNVSIFVITFQAFWFCLCMLVGSLIFLKYEYKKLNWKLLLCTHYIYLWKDTKEQIKTLARNIINTSTSVLGSLVGPVISEPQQKWEME